VTPRIGIVYNYIYSKRSPDGAQRNPGLSSSGGSLGFRFASSGLRIAAATPNPVPQEGGEATAAAAGRSLCYTESPWRH
jgi:hypothetical protein